ncbi:hypothetical protein KC340_g9711 [Hortaea werneckii]|nr:hypothetical protein KC342_g7277 [Hortaea werneckii]KAI7097739.1 hypothetical protein KC339_g9485 [Hortaea werneckii]KAI7225171.1 hypothetical protein KC365_g10139 [Hortaea werneckii]KAI7312930.1 hypothetical protein KC340_g9711 [Hortaea werneckii]
MAAGSMHESAATLRAATYRLSTTGQKQLAFIAPQIAAQLWHCKDLLSTTPESTKQNNEASVTVHRFKTKISSLLQDRTFEGRWAAVVLTKAAIEAGGVEVLSKSNAWVRSLIGILKRAGDPPTTRALAVVTLTRIFMLTWDYSNLVREITTPALPGFVSTCLNNVESNRCSQSELQTVLEAFAILVPRHPTIFRTNETQIRSLLTKIISIPSLTTTSGLCFSKQNQHTAHRVLVLLHQCAPKQGAAEKWDESLKSTVAAAHASCDRTFRSVVETWSSSAGVQPSVAPGTLFQGESQLDSDEILGLAGWNGIHAGVERIESLLHHLKAYVSEGTSQAVTMRLGLVVDLLARIFSVRAPHGKEHGLQINNQVPKDEREELFRLLPGLHVAAIELVLATMERFQHTIDSTCQPLLSYVVDALLSERRHVGMRTAGYVYLACVLDLHGASYEKQDIADIEPIIKNCCQELLPLDDSSTPGSTVASGKIAGAAGDMSLQHSKGGSSHPAALTDLHAAAKSLLPLCLSQLNAAYIPGKLRALMDRTAVLTQHKDALVASVLNPSPKTASSGIETSLLPLLAKQYPDQPEVEAVLRPRMPVIPAIKRRNTDGETDEEEDEDESLVEEIEIDQESERQTVPDGNNDAQPTDGLLNALGQNTESNDIDRSTVPTYRSTNDRSASEKRRAEEQPQLERSPKRNQPMPVAETLLPNAPDSLPGPDPVSMGANVPATIVTEQPPSSFVTAPEPSQQRQSDTVSQSAVAASHSVNQNAAQGDAESDFDENDLPPLTMESSDAEE